METAPDYTPILDRIPEKWGKYCDVKPGWACIVLDLNAALAELSPDYEIYQVKEKFGGLRYYAQPSQEWWEDADDESRQKFRNLIDEAERLAEVTCDLCGEPGETVKVSPYWLATRCPDHASQPN